MGHSKSSSHHVMGVPEGEEKEYRAEKLFDK